MRVLRLAVQCLPGPLLDDWAAAVEAGSAVANDPLRIERGGGADDFIVRVYSHATQSRNARFHAPCYESSDGEYHRDADELGFHENHLLRAGKNEL